MDYYLLQFQFKTPATGIDLLVEKATSEIVSNAFETWIRTQTTANRTRTFFALLGRTPGPELRKLTIDFDSVLYLATKPDPIVLPGDSLIPKEIRSFQPGKKKRATTAK